MEISEISEIFFSGNLHTAGRPSFFDNSTTEDISMHDQHQWSHVLILTEWCVYCSQKSLSRTISAVDRRTTDSSTTNNVVENSDQNMVCLGKLD